MAESAAIASSTSNEAPSRSGPIRRRSACRRNDRSSRNSATGTLKPTASKSLVATTTRMSRRGRCHCRGVRRIRRPRRVDVPAAVHPHVRAKNEIAAEPHQNVLARRGRRSRRSAGERCVFMNARQRRQHRLETHDLVPRQRAVQRPRRAIDGIPLRHVLPCSGPSSSRRARSMLPHRRICSPMADG